MARFARFNLFAAFRDLAIFLRGRERHEYVFGLLALAITGYVLFALNKDSKFVVGPQIVYVNSWPANRTDDQIKAELQADKAERDKVEAARRAEFKKVDDKLRSWGI